jgi:hypothetical protein
LRLLGLGRAVVIVVRQYFVFLFVCVAWRRLALDFYMLVNRGERTRIKELGIRKVNFQVLVLVSEHLLDLAGLSPFPGSIICLLTECGIFRTPLSPKKI